METKIWLIVSAGGRVRTTKKSPALRADEVAVRVSLILPKKLFERPLVNATLTVSEDAIAPKEITPELLVSTASLIEQETGMKVVLEVIPKEEKDDIDSSD